MFLDEFEHLIRFFFFCTLLVLINIYNGVLPEAI